MNVSTTCSYNAKLLTAPPVGRVVACQSAHSASMKARTWNTSTPECVTDRLILIPSPSWAGCGRMPYMSNFLATSSRWMSESAGDAPLHGDRGGETTGSMRHFFNTSGWRRRTSADFELHLCLLWNLMILWSRYSWLGTYCFISRCWQSRSSSKSPSSAVTQTHTNTHKHAGETMLTVNQKLFFNK